VDELRVPFEVVNGRLGRFDAEVVLAVVDEGVRLVLQELFGRHHAFALAGLERLLGIDGDREDASSPLEPATGSCARR
jgi:hypothetical protein